jgi:predicted metalloprotease with PDZ domain
MIPIRTITLGTLFAASAWPAVLPAQERRPESRTRVYVAPEGEELRERIRLVTQRRARLGVTVDLRATADDSVGAKINAVTPGGPAAKAGIQSGDIITRIDGKSLTSGGETKAGEDESLPGLRLIEIASQLKAEQTVAIEYKRGSSRHTTNLVTGDEPMVSLAYPDWFQGGRAGVVSPRLQFEPFSSGRIEGWPSGAFTMRLGGPLMDLELAPLNQDLGQYFGTSDGVLVIDVPKESSLGLKGGDVILSVDGRKATSPSSLLRILRSYEPEDSFRLEIMRNRARTTVTGKLDKPHDQ